MAFSLETFLNQDLICIILTKDVLNNIKQGNLLKLYPGDYEVYVPEKITKERLMETNKIEFQALVTRNRHAYEQTLFEKRYVKEVQFFERNLVTTVDRWCAILNPDSGIFHTDGWDDMPDSDIAYEGKIRINPPE